ncbi:MAG TPA: DUF488 domain-containing protein [Fimbriimonas sp.]
MTILTAGYGNRGFDKFIELIKAHGVTHLVDVRSVPQSGYWEDFRKARLEQIVPPTGIRYVYMGDTLGGTPAAASGARPPLFCRTEPGQIDLEPLFADPRFRLGLRKLVEAASVEGRRFCLMCGCLRPFKCHRFRLIGEALANEGVEVLHLDEKGEPVPHARVVEQAKSPQGELF